MILQPSFGGRFLVLLALACFSSAQAAGINIPEGSCVYSIDKKTEIISHALSRNEFSCLVTCETLDSRAKLKKVKFTSSAVMLFEVLGEGAYIVEKNRQMTARIEADCSKTVDELLLRKCDPDRVPRAASSLLTKGFIKVNGKEVAIPDGSANEAGSAR